MTDTVCTLFELRAGDDTVNEGNASCSKTKMKNYGMQEYQTCLKRFLTL